MSEKKGTISVKTQDVFPIIKKWLYSEHDIFIRELVANATDAITKRGTNARTLNQETPEGKIIVSLNKSNKTLKITDNGIGMTESEVEKYIAQLAFSGAEEFVNKMKETGTEASNDIIGKFGLGFYSAFMVADKVEVDSLSMNENSKPTKWTCEGDVDYIFSESDKSDVGTTITLHISKDYEEFLDFYKMKQTLEKFCDFMPISIGVLDEEKVEYPKKDDGTEDKTLAPLPNEPQQINETTPLWKRDPSELKDEDYKEFYRKLYPMEQEPLFWIHLRVDHPFTLEGILYFPKLNLNKPFNQNSIKLYAKQVYVSDSVKDIIPEFLSLLKGSIDSPDIPLNVSRSSLQGDPNIKKISNYVVKKVADALKKLFNTDRKKFEEIWPDTGLFIKYGCLSDLKFDELMRKNIVFKTEKGNYLTLKEYSESIPEKYKEKVGDKVLYSEVGKSDKNVRAELSNEGIHSIETDDHIDPHFMQHVETHKQDDKSFQFSSIEMEVGNILETESTNADDIRVKELFEKILAPETSSDKEKGEEKQDQISKTLSDNNLDVSIEKFKSSTAPAYIKVDEQMKRFSKMTAQMGGNNSFPIKKTLVINPNNQIIQNALKIHDKGDNSQLVEKICHHVEDLAQISSEGLKDENKENFVKRSQELIKDLTSLAL